MQMRCFNELESGMYLRCLLLILAISYSALVSPDSICLRPPPVLRRLLLMISRKCVSSGGLCEGRLCYEYASSKLKLDWFIQAKGRGDVPEWDTITEGNNKIQSQVRQT